MRPKTKRRLRWTLITVVGMVVLTLLVLYGMFRYTSVCTICGAEQETLEWQVPLLGLPYWSNHHTHDTMLSTALRHSGLVGPHRHHWLFASGSGNGSMCAIGQGRYLWHVIKSPEAVVFLETVAHYHGKPEAQRCLEVLLDPKSTYAATLAIDMASPPSAGFPHQATFETWAFEHRSDLSALPLSIVPPAGTSPSPSTQATSSAAIRP